MPYNDIFRNSYVATAERTLGDFRRNRGVWPVNGYLVAACSSCVLNFICGYFVVPESVILCWRGGGGGGA